MKHVKTYGYIAIFPILQGLFMIIAQFYYAQFQRSGMNIDYFVLEYIFLFIQMIIGGLALYWLYLIKKNNTKLTRRILLGTTVVALFMIVLSNFYILMIQIEGSWSMPYPNQVMLTFYLIAQLAYTICYSSAYLVFSSLGFVLFILLRKESKRAQTIPHRVTIDQRLEEPKIGEENPCLKQEEVQIVSFTSKNETILPKYEDTSLSFVLDDSDDADDAWKANT